LLQSYGTNMTNEEYLIISYFTAGLISLGFAIFAYRYLRCGFVEIMQSVSSKHLFQIFRKLFLIGIVLPALFGFFSVSFRSCSRDTYDKIIAERAYLFAKNQEQLSSSLFYIVIALLVWGLILFSALFIIKHNKTPNNS